MVDGVGIRAARETDAGALAEALARNRAHMRATEPHRSERYYTAEAQAELLADGGRRWFAVKGDRILGAAILSGIVLGPFRSASLGYWVDGGHTRRGIASALVDEVIRASRDELGLHRIEASTLLDNHASQRVLAGAGFERIGTAPRYLHIDGAWRDHHLFQRILHDQAPPLA
ncbi:GNAT family protein [Streptomyces sp. CC208A]|uniref:GNAT family N-acetyltransferase n=1 Tax=Streptomyces sp. CC208A TaxID=3044573 RepID=UPI0024A88472|nr:GNAT family protein [Streptomyces sp. CC208A]